MLMDRPALHHTRRIAVIGAGSWGTTLASLLAEKGYEVVLWAFEKEVADSINRDRVNRVYLPAITLPETLKAAYDIQDAVAQAPFVVSVVPTQHVRQVFTRARYHLSEEAVIVSASKGIEVESLLTPSMILSEILLRPVGVLSGPSFAQEVVRKYPTAVTLAIADEKSATLLQEIFNTDFFRVYTHSDVIGVEVGAALKNVIAIASGISDGLGLGHNARAALITRGLAEIARLGVSMHAKLETFAGLSGLGDLVLTCTGSLSRNYTVGQRLAKGEKLRDILARSRSVAEGVTTTRSAYQLSQRHAIEMPITAEVYRTLYEDKNPRDAVMDLMTRSPKPEFHG
jgi:glycerol-3-phosphate dehydrogenase (NAD(P)+)